MKETLIKYLIMRDIKLFRLLILLTIAGLFAASCKSDRTARYIGDMTDEETGEIFNRIEQVKKVYHLCPSPAEMLGIIDVAEMKYNGDLLNPPQNIDKYLDTKSQTLNLGIYITDMAYAALFGRNEETIDYLETVQKVAEKIRVSGAVDETLINRAKKNVNFIDSLFILSNEAFINMLYFCEKNNRSNTIMMISAGAYVESLYLAINMIEHYDAADYLVQHLAEQKYALDNLMAFAESLDDDTNVLATIQQLKPLSDIYNRLETAGGATTVKKESENKLVIGGGKKIMISEEDFKQLKEIALQIRHNIVLTDV
jgi:hypothetical protein